MANQSLRAFLVQVQDVTEKEVTRKRALPDYVVMDAPDPLCEVRPAPKRRCTFSSAEEQYFELFARNLQPNKCTVRPKTFFSFSPDRALTLSLT